MQSANDLQNHFFRPLRHVGLINRQFVSLYLRGALYERKDMKVADGFTSLLEHGHIVNPNFKPDNLTLVVSTTGSCTRVEVWAKENFPHTLQHLSQRFASAKVITFPSQGSLYAWFHEHADDLPKDEKPVRISARRQFIGLGG